MGPVFVSEWLAVSRRWQWYAARAVFLAGVLAALTLVWWARAVNRPARSVQAQAEVGRLFCGAMMVTQLAMVLLVAPAATAGSICLDRARGTLAHMLVTDLSTTEIVIGKLAARTVPVLGIILCVLPIPALGTFLGGIDPGLLAGGVVVALGAAVVGCSAALALSTWGTKTHEVLLATYAAWAVWLLALPMWWGYRQVHGGMAPPRWLEHGNPMWLVAGPYLWPGTLGLREQVTFLWASLFASAALTALAATQLRRVAVRQMSRRRADRSSRRRLRILGRLLSLVPGPSLDANPVLWREWHRRRPSRWARTVWCLYAVMTIGLSLTLMGITPGGGVVRRQVASVGNGFQAGIGLLLLSVSAATVLAEERVRGNLDILLATPLSTRSIVWGKWWGTYRAVPVLAICPGVVAAVLSRDGGRWEGTVMIVGLFLAYGSAVTSLGLALATWVRRLDYAVALNVAMLGGVTFGWLFAVALMEPRGGTIGLAAGSPIIGIMFPTVAMNFFTSSEWESLVGWWCFWIAVYAAVAALLAWAVVKTFDRCLGRIPDPRR
jgi:ABC-type transport system involved in multi-copper enzyme maturation permease subunit